MCWVKNWSIPFFDLLVQNYMVNGGSIYSHATWSIIQILNEINDTNFDIFSTETYLHNCVIEHIRLFNTININIQRSVKENMIYHDINLKKGDQIFILFSSILRDESKFHKADYFIPERWENKSIDEQNIVLV